MHMLAYSTFMSHVHVCRAHQAWDLPTPPDFVTFAKKMQLGGFFYRASARPKEVGPSS